MQTKHKMAQKPAKDNFSVKLENKKVFIIIFHTTLNLTVKNFPGTKELPYNLLYNS